MDFKHEKLSFPPSFGFSPKQPTAFTLASGGTAQRHLVLNRKPPLLLDGIVTRGFLYLERSVAFAKNVEEIAFI